MRSYRDVGWDKMDTVLTSLDDEIYPKSCIRFFRELDFSGIERVRMQYQARGAPKPSYTAFIVAAIAQALDEYRFANRRLFWGFPRPRLVEFAGIHVSVAVERETRSAGPETIYDADCKTLEALTAHLTALASHTQAQDERWTLFEKWVKRLPRFLSVLVVSYLPRIFPSLWLQWRGGATLVTSPAKYGVDMISGFWHWPLTFSFGYVRPRPVAVDGRVEVRPTAMLGLVWDRRVMVGAPAARFFNRVAQLLEDPTALKPRDSVESPEVPISG